ncbi:hypothetical protein HY486_03110 [Candidatus Woesearchaeota archaeon]|nr:hypothetical protein [Candidatus Woesearchaeota archaeon]
MPNIKDQYQNAAQALYERCLDGELSPSRAALAVHQAIGGVTAVFFSSQRFTVQNHQCRVSLHERSSGKADTELTCRLAVALYDIAKQRGEVHISAQASSKHHKAGLGRYRYSC